jgi:hypothetical protein
MVLHLFFGVCGSGNWVNPESGEYCHSGIGGVNPFGRADGCNGNHGAVHAKAVRIFMAGNRYS